MRRILMVSACAGALALLGACNRSNNLPSAPSQSSPTQGSNLAAATAGAAAPLADPQRAAQAANALDQSVSAPSPAIQRYDASQDGRTVRAAEDPSRGLRVAEGGRTYFYQPGQDTPYLVRQGGYSYAYDRGRLTGILDQNDQRVDQRTQESMRRNADQWLIRARAAHRSAIDQAPPAARHVEQQAQSSSATGAGSAHGAPNGHDRPSPPTDRQGRGGRQVGAAPTAQHASAAPKRLHDRNKRIPPSDRSAAG